MNKKNARSMALLATAHFALMNNMGVSEGPTSGGFSLPDINPSERILSVGQKVRKHATKRRGNKFHDKKRKKV